MMGESKSWKILKILILTKARGSPPTLWIPAFARMKGENQKRRSHPLKPP